MEDIILELQQRVHSLEMRIIDLENHIKHNDKHLDFVEQSLSK